MAEKNYDVCKKFIWSAIKNYEDNPITQYENKTYSKSQDFKIEIGGFVTTWRIHLYPNGESAENLSHISIYLYRVDSDSILFNVDFKMSMGNKKESIVQRSDSKSGEDFKDMSHGWLNFMSHEHFEKYKKDYIEGNKLIITCEIKLSLTKVETPEFSLAEDVLKMLEDTKLADFVLKCSDGDDLKCHKFILAARSPVFLGMLTNDMKEFQQGFAKVMDFDSRVMKEVLRFIYSSKVENFDKLSSQLVYAAEKYQLMKLKQICIENIIKNLSKENVVKSFTIANQINSETLFEECIRVAKSNFFDVEKTQDWNKLPKSILLKIVSRIMLYSPDGEESIE